jgi:Protein of unknown function (DUF2785)
MDRELWESIVASDAEVPPGHTAAELLPGLLDLLGSPDPFLRDEVGYGVLARWVVHDQLIGPDQLRQCAERLLPDLRYGLDGDDGDEHAVLRRSFSALALAIIAYRDVEEQFLQPAEVNQLLEAGIAYLLDETDRRGWVPEMGWIHATAHAADLLKFLVRNPLTDRDDHRRVLAALQTLLTGTGPVFKDDEEDRLVLVVVDVLGRETIGDAELVEWIDGFGSWLGEHTEGAFDPTVHATATNVKRFVRTLHLALCSRAHRRGLKHDQAELAALDTARRFAAGPI